MHQNLEQFRFEVDITLKRWTLCTGLAFSAYFLKEIPEARNRLPEPLDFVDHIGNTNMSLLLGGVAAYHAGEWYENRQPEDKSSEQLKRRARNIIGTAGLVAGIALNAYTETKTGLKINPFFDETTADPVDFAYGVAGGVAGAYLLNRIRIFKESSIPPA